LARAPHTIATPYPCGGVSFLCPKGSWYPVLVGGGNFTIGGDRLNQTRTGKFGRVIEGGYYSILVVSCFMCSGA